MGYKRLSVQLAVRLSGILASLIAIAFLLQQPGYTAVTALICCLTIVQCIALVKYINKTNIELTRFLSALKHADYSQRFKFTELGCGFDELGTAFEAIVKEQQAITASKEAKQRKLTALIEQVPVPLISLHEDERVTLWNSKARKLFGTVRCENIADLNQWHTSFVEQLLSIPNGGARLIKIVNDDSEQQLMVTASELIVEGKQEKLFSLQNIQSALDSAQLQAWQDLVRVLTHEIMNSITPISSLAKTASDLIQDLQHNYSTNTNIREDLEDIASAVNTVASRSDGLTQFVSGYRKLTRLPAPNRTTFYIADFFDQLYNVVNQDLQHKGIQLVTSVTPQQLELIADKQMLTQVFINLIKNAEQALETVANPTIRISANINTRNHVTIKIGDNGAGIPEDLIEQIFVPFFTTKKEGSGVGLALTRQAMILHGGAVKVENGAQGAVFTLVF